MSKHLEPYCAQQALAGGLGGGIVPPLAADGGSNEGEETIKEEEPDSDENNDTNEQVQAGEVYVCLNFSYSKMLS